MKIAVMIPGLSRSSVGGAELYLLGIADILALKHDVTIFTLGNPNYYFGMDRVYKKYGVRRFKTRPIFFLPVGLRHPFLRIVSCFWLQLTIRYINAKFDMLINDNKSMTIGPANIKSLHIVHFPEQPLSKTFECAATKKFDQKYLASYSAVLPNSEFTNYWLEKYWAVRGFRVLYPLISMDAISAVDMTKKENIILAVGRLVPDKKIKEMICAFVSLCQKSDNNYKLVIAGNEDNHYISYEKELESLSSGCHIEFRKNITNEELLASYKQAKIFWHAKGFGDIDEPSQMEHFGMTTVEAMANGCVPVVIDKGGQKEIVSHGIDGYRWNSIEELLQYTEEIINDKGRLRELQANAVKKAKFFLKEAFENNLSIIIDQVVRNPNGG